MAETQTLRRAAAVVVAAVVVAALVGASTAHASKFIKKGIYDDAQVLYGNPDKVFPVLQQMGTQVLRVNLWWGGPNGVARRRPANASNPADPAYNWATYDRTVRYANAFKMEPVFTVLGTPAWANASAGWNAAPSRTADLQAFVTAAARRYSGTYAIEDGTIATRVSKWIAWNEPNNPVFLRPQFVQSGGAWVMQSAADYARICNAVVKAVKSVSRTSKVACGVTSPRGNNQPGTTRTSVSPLAFLRAMKKAGAKGFDAYAHHPYYGYPSETPSTKPPPGKRGQPTTAVTLGNFELLTREVARLYGNMRIWVTEYGYQTNPPDKQYGVSPERQALYLTQAWTKLAANPRVDMMIWFLLRDEERVAAGWQSGLYTARGARKPAREAFERLVP
ncbi:MAG: DUF5722 domain-containing protein [Thermoleophilia bacterium]